MADDKDRSYYNENGTIETADFIAAQGLSFAQGSAIKYIVRAGRKMGADPVEDYRKAIRFTEFAINQAEGRAPTDYGYETPEEIVQRDWPDRKDRAGFAAVTYFTYRGVQRIVLNAYIKRPETAVGDYKLSGLEVWNSRDEDLMPHVKDYFMYRLEGLRGEYVDPAGIIRRF